MQFAIFGRTMLDLGAMMGLQAIITYDTLPNDGFLALEGSVRNTSCVTALLNVNATTPSGRRPLPSSVYLLLLDQHGMEDLVNPSTAQLVPTGGCQAGVSTTSCAFTASGLVPGQAYHMWLVYTGNRSADGLRDDALVTATFATSTSAGERPLKVVTLLACWLERTASTLAFCLIQLDDMSGIDESLTSTHQPCCLEGRIIPAAIY